MELIRLEFLLFLSSGMALWAPNSPAAIPVGNGAYPPAPAGEFVGDVTDVRVVDQYERHPGASLVWEPYIAEWKPNHLIAAYGVGVPGKTDMGDIVASISIDGGATWGYPVTVFDHRERQGAIQFAYGNAILYKAPDQNVAWCYAIRCPIGFYHSEDSQLAGAFSADGGRTWTPVEMAMDYMEPLVVVAGIYRLEEKGHVRYLCPAQRNTLADDPKGEREEFILSSTSLLEWKLESYIPQPGPVFGHEGNLAAGDELGELKLVMRTALYNKLSQPADPPRARSSVSRDGGRTWSPAKEEPDLYNSVSKAFFGRAADGTHLYIYSDGPAWSRKALRYKLQPPGGKWGAERTFFETGGHNSYPTLIEVAPGDFRAVWDSGTKELHRTRILFGKFHVGS